MLNDRTLTTRNSVQKEKIYMPLDLHQSLAEFPPEADRSDLAGTEHHGTHDSQMAEQQSGQTFDDSPGSPQSQKLTRSPETASKIHIVERGPRLNGRVHIAGTANRPNFQAGNEVIIDNGPYKYVRGVFLTLKDDVGWASIKESSGAISSHPVEWMAILSNKLSVFDANEKE